MNITLDKSAVFASNYHVVTGKRKKSADKKEELTQEQVMINQFKEQHSRENTKSSDIYSKFRAGKKLTPEELEYLAKESPELYKQIKEIMMERQAMEEQMEAAESKEEVASIHLNQVMNIKQTMGTGEEAERQAEKTMARVNQTGAALKEYTATAEYKEKEDAKSRAEELREQLEELERQQEAFRDRIAEKQEEEAEAVSEETEEAASGSSSATFGEYGSSEEQIISGSGAASKPSDDGEQELAEESPERMSTDDGKEKAGIRRRRKKKHAPLPDEKAFRIAAADYKELRQKVRELYHTERNAVLKSADSAKSEHTGIDVSL